MNKNMAVAKLQGTGKYSNIKGEVRFHQKNGYVVIEADIYNLPSYKRGADGNVSPFGFHIHNGSSCEVGMPNNPFPKSGTHYNPNNQQHGNHAGDFPVLIPMTNGHAYMTFITDKFTVAEVIGFPLIVHESPDDYITQPSGNSGNKIACGIIEG